jgi:hypothetical protein
VNVRELTSDPNPEEAAALIAAVERFLLDTTAPTAAVEETVPGWRRAALLEGIGERDQNALW